jgi:DNA repair protein SbcD/Mre11
MKILHTGDWHIGKIVNQERMLEDQEYILKQIIDIIKSEKPDVMIIAGDIYDRAVPPVEAVELLNNVFNKILLDLKVPIIAIAGNHDSPDRLEFGNELFKDKGLYIEGTFKKAQSKVVLEDEFGPVNFYLIPFAETAVMREVLGNEGIHSLDDAFTSIVNNIKTSMNTKERNVIVAHGYIKGEEELVTSDSERPLSIGGTEAINSQYFQDFEYTALGHLHGYQKVKSDKLRYCGSILKYSFSEVKHKKSVTLVNMDGSGNLQIEQKTLIPLRDMRIIKGNLSALLEPAIYKSANSEDYIKAILTDEGELIEPMNKLKAVYSNVLELERENKNRKNENIKTSASEGYKHKSKLELFSNFYTGITGKEFTKEKADIITSVIEKVERQERGE